MNSVKEIIIRLTETIKLFEENPESFEKIWNIPDHEIETLGIPQDLYQRMKELGESQVRKIIEMLKIDSLWLVEVTKDLNDFGKMAVPQKKLALFLLEDCEENLEFIYDRKWFYMAINPDRDRMLKKWHSHENAKMRKRGRLIKSYGRYLPTLTQKYKNLLAKKQTEAASSDHSSIQE